MAEPSDACFAAVAQPQCPDVTLLLPLVARREMACAGDRWVSSLMSRLEAMYNVRPNGTDWQTAIEPRGHRRFDAMLPTAHGACKLSTFGRGDGAKRLCGLETLPRCAVLSIGSRGDTKFEQHIVKRTNCTVDILDCTVPRCGGKRGKWPPEMRTGRVRYHRVCMDSRDHTEMSAKIRQDWKQASESRFEFRTYASILSRLRLGSVSAMKMDIEGFEFSVLEPMLRQRSATLPTQIAFELHWQTQMTSLSWHGRAKTAGEIALFARALYDAGYRALSRDDNRRCPHCSEFNVVRLFCPPPALPLEPQVAAPDFEADARKSTWGTGDPGADCDG